MVKVLFKVISVMNKKKMSKAQIFVLFSHHKIWTNPWLPTTCIATYFVGQFWHVLFSYTPQNNYPFLGYGKPQSYIS
jgi:hypothetical protein